MCEVDGKLDLTRIDQYKNRPLKIFECLYIMIAYEISAEFLRKDAYFGNRHN